MKRAISRLWIPLVLVVVLAVSGLIVMRLHRIFGSQNLNAAGVSIKIVQFHPKILVYDVFGSAGSTAQIDYFDADANTHEVNIELPWSLTISTTLRHGQHAEEAYWLSASSAPPSRLVCCSTR